MNYAPYEVNGRVHRALIVVLIPAGLAAVPAESRPRWWPRSGSGCTQPRSGRSPRCSVSSQVGRDATFQVEAVRYSVPHTLVGTAVWVRRVRSKMADAVTLGQAARHGCRRPRSGNGGDLMAILAHQGEHEDEHGPTRATEQHSLQPGTSAWSGFGAVAPPAANHSR